jgi:hypothetical protein
MLIITAFVFTLCVRQFINNKVASKKRKMLVHRITSTVLTYDKDGASGCRISIGERNVQCLSIDGGRFARRQRSEAMSEYANYIMKKTKQLVLCIVTLIRNAIRIHEISFDGLKETITKKNLNEKRSVLDEIK